MKKASLIITSGVYALLLCSVFFYYSCSRDHTDCSRCQLTDQEKSLLSAYNSGNIAVFKNDMTSVYDTLHVTNKIESRSGCSDPCQNSIGGINAYFIFSHIKECQVTVWRNLTPYISISGSGSPFELSGTFQSMTINSSTYNDVYVPSVDSTKITSVDRNNVPWKIAYSRTKGFIRFYMTNGQTWSKL